MKVDDDVPPHSPLRRRIGGHGTDEPTWRASAEVGDLPETDVSDWAERYRRIWLVAPHPDDEILGLGGSLSRLSSLHADLAIVSVTDGEASHRDSSVWPADRLARVRPAEMRRGLDALAVAADVVRLGLPDGRVAAHRKALLQALVERVADDDLILATCRFDGHPDHEACGEVAVMAGEMTGAAVFEYPVWMWHWATPGETIIPWKRARRLALAPETLARKRDAIGQFESQITDDGPAEAVLPPHVLPRFLRPFEVVFT